MFSPSLRTLVSKKKISIVWITDIQLKVHLGESIPAGPAGLVKCTHELSFTNKIYHKRSRQWISVPPRRKSQMMWSQDIPQGLKYEVMKVRDMIYGGWLENLEPVSYRMCW